jgi:drug/metabolite transporter (DMT)-like permease
VTPLAIVMVLGAVVTHALWNLFVKSSTDRLGAMMAVLGAIGLVGLVLIPFFPMPASPEVWALLGISALVHYGYNGFLLLSYRYGDLSQAYPVARGSVPLLVMALAYYYPGELPSTQGVVGVCTVAFGILLLSLGSRRAGLHGIILAVITGFWIAGYTVLDGVGVRTAITPGTYIAWLFATHLVPPVLVMAFVWRGRAPFGFWRTAGIGFLAPVAYGLVLLAKISTDLAAVSALRETSVLLAAILGVFLLGEGQARLRLSAAAIVAIGAVLVTLS